MQVTQIYDLVNNITNEITGKENLLNEDLSNVIDVGTEIFDSTSVDKYVNKLVDRIGRTIFVNRKYNGSVASVYMDAWEFGSVLEKISADLPNATENESWELTDGTEYNPNIFYKPSVSAKFFNKKVTFEIPMSFTELQVKSSFNSANELNAFISMLYNAVEKSMAVKMDGLIMRTINNMTAQTIYSSFGEQTSYAETDNIKAVNLLKQYNEKFQTTLTVANALSDPEFIRYASYIINLYTDRLSKMSTLFNVGAKERFTPKENLHIVLLSDFKKSADVYLQSDTFNNELTQLPNAETVSYWQGSGNNFDFSDVSTINVTTQNPTATGTVTVNLSGILGVMFDSDALGVSNLDRRVTTNYNAKAEFYNNWYKFDCGYFNDMNENFVVFFIA